MYGLLQAGILIQKLLSECLQCYGYFQRKLVHELWKHKWHPIQFALVVDDFAVKYMGVEHARHLVSVLKQNFKMSEGWKGNKFIGLAIDWNYDSWKVHISIPKYVHRALT